MRWSKQLPLILFVILELLCWVSWYRAPDLGHTSDYYSLYISLAAMSVWCAVFFRKERFAARLGLLSILAILLLGLLFVSR